MWVNLPQASSSDGNLLASQGYSQQLYHHHQYHPVHHPHNGNSQIPNNYSSSPPHLHHHLHHHHHHHPAHPLPHMPVSDNQSVPYHPSAVLVLPTHHFRSYPHPSVPLPSPTPPGPNSVTSHGIPLASLQYPRRNSKRNLTREYLLSDPVSAPTEDMNSAEINKQFDDEIDEIVDNLMKNDMISAASSHHTFDYSFPFMSVDNSTQPTTTNISNSSSSSSSGSLATPLMSNHVHHSPGHTNGTISDESPPINDHFNISIANYKRIRVPDTLFRQLSRRFPGQFRAKQDICSRMQQVMKRYGRTRQFVGEQREFVAWVDGRYVYCTEPDERTLCGIFDFQQFHAEHRQCMQMLRSAKMIASSAYSSACSSSSMSVKATPKYMESKDKMSLKDAAIIAASPVLSKKKKEGSPPLCHPKYHTIYLKPIMERVQRKINSVVDGEFIINIVDNAISYGDCKQISKRMFEFTWNEYTVIMSKSLKTILDVAVSPSHDHVTVHPDVVSIISKKCQQLDYFTIQALAEKAKRMTTCTTKKNDYRQQFIYDFKDCRIVFASNHTTIVEMQCHNPTALANLSSSINKN